MAQGSEFYVPNMITKDHILLTTGKNGHPDIKGWADQELINNKTGWEAVGIVGSCLLNGTYRDHMGNVYEIPQIIAQSFTEFPPPAIFEGNLIYQKLLIAEQPYKKLSTSPTRCCAVLKRTTLVGATTALNVIVTAESKTHAARSTQDQ
jgi:hypothetical protein